MWRFLGAYPLRSGLGHDQVEQMAITPTSSALQCPPKPPPSSSTPPVPCAWRGAVTQDVRGAKFLVRQAQGSQEPMANLPCGTDSTTPGLPRVWLWDMIYWCCNPAWICCLLAHFGIFPSFPTRSSQVLLFPPNVSGCALEMLAMCDLSSFTCPDGQSGIFLRKYGHL